MCGRFRLQLPWKEIASALNLVDSEAGRNLPAMHNIAPSQALLTVEGTDRCVITKVWGLVPSWAKPDKTPKPMINARGETVHEKPFFRTAFKQGRCLIPADGWYEWTGEKGDKQPHLIDQAGAPFAFAGIAAVNEALDLASVAIVTVPTADSIAHIHHRMPAVLTPDAREAWLDPKTAPAEAHRLLSQVEGDFSVIAVDRAINSAKAKGPAEPINPK